MKRKTLGLLTASLIALGIAIGWAGSAGGLESRLYKLYKVTESRGPVTRIGFAYYPASRELRVRVIVGGRIEAWGVYSDPDTVKNLLTIIGKDTDGLFCVFDDNDLIALYRE